MLITLTLWGLKKLSLRWRHNDHYSVSNHQPHGCLLNRLFRRRWKKTSKLRVTGLCVGNSPGPVNSPHRGPVTRKMFPFDDVIMIYDYKRFGQVTISVILCGIKWIGHSPTLMVTAWKVRNVYMISSQTLMGMWSLMHVTIKITPSYLTRSRIISEEEGCLKAMYFTLAVSYLRWLRNCDAVDIHFAIDMTYVAILNIIGNFTQAPYTQGHSWAITSNH